MRISDLIRISAKNLKGRWALLPALGAAISTFCFCFSGAVLVTVEEEKALPCELNVSSGSTSLSDGVTAEISEISDVTAVTPIIQVPAVINADEYSAQLTLTGIEAAYLNGTLAQGSFFPDSSAMPYIVLSEPACKLFSVEGIGGFETADGQIDWLNASVSVQTEEGSRPTFAKISGILANDDEDEQEPAAYISISSAKQLQLKGGQATEYTRTDIRITNIGRADSVSKAIESLGLAVENKNEEMQTKWDAEMKETAYLIVIGTFCLLCSAVLMTAWRKISFLEQKEAYAALRWIGMKGRGIGALFAVQALMISLFGIAVGILVSASLPSFLSMELQGSSIYTLPIPPGVAGLSAAVCAAAGMAPLGIRSNYYVSRKSV